MAKSSMHTIWYRVDGKYYKVFKVGFGGDGSYYVTAPYHPLDKAILGKFPVNYALGRPVTLREAIKKATLLASLDDDENRLKLSHHPSGFIQFSGSGIVSGRKEGGGPKGIGVTSWELSNPTFGPSFSVLFAGPDRLGREGLPTLGDVAFDSTGLEHMRMSGRPFLDVHFAGHYFPPRFRSFVRRDSEGHSMDIVNPESSVVQQLRVVLASRESGFPGLIGIWAEPMELEYEGFWMTSSTGRLRRNQLGDLIGDQLFCLYPPPDDLSTVRLESLNFASLPTPSYKAPGRSSTSADDGVRRSSGRKNSRKRR